MDYNTIPTYPLSMFRWRPSQKRLVIDNNAYMSNYNRIEISGKHLIITFVYHETAPDMFTRSRKLSAIYYPDGIMTPLEKKNIVLYIHL